MRAGDVIAERFTLEELVGAGGMGAVFRAHDRHADETVAVKVMRERYEGSAVRFFLEARVLAELRHPAIVRYVGHGRTVGAAHWLAMEWLDGLSLADRLDGGPLAIAEALALARRTAEGLAVAHARGVVHRDVKPSNLYLVGGSFDRVKVLDFGVARVGRADLAHTGAGQRVGTPRYMAPEQVRGDRDVDARADVFALGGLLYTALTGRPPFPGEDEMAVFAQILLEEPEPLARTRPDVPPALERLITRMLAKDAGARPGDARAVEEELRQLSADTVMGGTLGAGAAPAESEPRLGSLILAPRVVDVAAARAAAVRHGAEVDHLADGSHAFLLAGGRSAVEQANQAARLALELSRLSDGPLALATGATQRVGLRLEGVALERAAALLAGAGPPGIAVDDVSAGLLGAGFEVDGPPGAHRLVGESEQRDDRSRTLLGQRTPFVGRERELRTLEAIFDECVGDQVARVVLVTAPPGLGKSRLRRELSDRLRARHPELQLFLGRGDPMRAGSPFSLLVPALRYATGVRDGEPAAEAAAKLAARVAEVAAGDDARRVATFLGEILGVHEGGAEHVQLRAARSDPQLMGDQLRRAWEDFLGAECARQPVLLVLEDLHYGDLPSVKLIDAALRNVAGPLLVLALARPEVHALFPGLWGERATTEIRLPELSPRAAAQLARAVLGELDDGELGDLLDRAGGNALYLEELVRARAEGGQPGALPETLLAMVQLRIEGFPPEARRILRAGSIFGEVFWPGALGEVGDARERGEWLRLLADKEVLARRLEARFPGEEEWAFRHSLMREAAYASFAAPERARAHRAAGEWLEARGESDAMLLAAHFERGGEPRRAVGWVARASEQALEGNDFALALERAELALSWGATGRAAAALHLVAAQAHAFRGGNAEAIAAARRAISSAPRGDAVWAHALAQMAPAAGKIGDRAALAELAGALTAPPALPPAGPTLNAAARLVTSLRILGMTDEADRVEPLLDAPADTIEPGVAARVAVARSIRCANAGDVAGYLRLSEAAVAAFEGAGDLRGALGARANVGFALVELGDYAGAVATLRATLATARRLGVAAATSAALLNLGWALARSGALDEGLAVEREAVRTFAAQGARTYQGSASLYLGRMLLEQGDVAGAREALEDALGFLAAAAPLHTYARAALAEAHLAAGRRDAALAEAEAAAAALEALGELHEGEAYVRLLHARALASAGRPDDAAAALARARARLHARAAHLSDPTLRRQFLEAVPENRATLA
jgi:tetratricopeptide (TPR) repeat protein